MTLPQKSDVLLTSDAKKDKKKTLEAKLQECLRKINSIDRQQSVEVEERKQKERELNTLKVKKVEEAEHIISAMKEEEINFLEKIVNAEKENAYQEEQYHKVIKTLCDKLEEHQRIHFEKYVQLVKKIHTLNIEIDNMNAHEEKLKRELSETRQELARIKEIVDYHEHKREIVALHKQSSVVLEKDDAQIKKTDKNVEQLLSPPTGEPTSSQASDADSKGDDQQ